VKRSQLEHVIRAAAALAQSRELVVLGSQAILGAHPDAPNSLLTSQEVDLYPLDNPDKADLIDGSIGELSPFHETFGYYAHGVGPDTAVLPSGSGESASSGSNLPRHREPSACASIPPTLRSASSWRVVRKISSSCGSFFSIG
jgi:hypothetical protein